MVHFPFMQSFGGDGDSDTGCPRQRTSIRSKYLSNRQWRSPMNRFHGTWIFDPQHTPGMKDWGLEQSVFNLFRVYRAFIQ